MRRKTRFFAAACVTNRVLAQLVVLQLGARSVGSCRALFQLPYPISVSVPCTQWLAHLGGELERANLQVAAAVDTGSIRGPGLDARIVSFEQSLVQQWVVAPSVAPLDGFSRIELELDALLNPHWLAFIHYCPQVRWYSRVLSGVRSELSAPLQFIRQPHREKIGGALIESLSRHERASSFLHQPLGILAL